MSSTINNCTIMTIAENNIYDWSGMATQRGQMLTGWGNNKRDPVLPNVHGKSGTSAESYIEIW